MLELKRKRLNKLRKHLYYKMNTSTEVNKITVYDKIMIELPLLFPNYWKFDVLGVQDVHIIADNVILSDKKLHIRERIGYEALSLFFGLRLDEIKVLLDTSSPYKGSDNFFGGYVLHECASHADISFNLKRFLWYKKKLITNK